MQTKDGIDIVFGKSDSQPCSAATLNSCSGIASANALDSFASVTASRGFAECDAVATDASIGGGRYAVFFAPRLPRTGAAGALDTDAEDADALKTGVPNGGEDESSGKDADVEGDMGGDDGVSDAEDAYEEGMEESASSEMPSSIVGSMSFSSQSSMDGKKLRKSASACHLEECLNSIQTSIRPGRDRAGSRRSRWFVVLRNVLDQDLTARRLETLTRRGSALRTLRRRRGRSTARSDSTY